MKGRGALRLRSTAFEERPGGLEVKVEKDSGFRGIKEFGRQEKSRLNYHF